MAEIFEQFYQSSELSFYFGSPGVHFCCWVLPSVPLTHLPHLHLTPGIDPGGEWGAARLWIVICGFGKRFWGQHSELRETRVQVLTLPCIKCMILHKSLKTFQALVCLFCKMGMEIPALACEHAFVSPRALHRSSTALLLLSLLLT